CVGCSVDRLSIHHYHVLCEGTRPTENQRHYHSGRRRGLLERRIRRMGIYLWCRYVVCGLQSPQALLFHRNRLANAHRLGHYASSIRWSHYSLCTTFVRRLCRVRCGSGNLVLLWCTYHLERIQKTKNNYDGIKCIPHY